MNEDIEIEDEATDEITVEEDEPQLPDSEQTVELPEPEQPNLPQTEPVSTPVNIPSVSHSADIAPTSSPVNSYNPAPVSGNFNVAPSSPSHYKPKAKSKNVGWPRLPLGKSKNKGNKASNSKSNKDKGYSKRAPIKPYYSLLHPINISPLAVNSLVPFESEMMSNLLEEQNGSSWIVSVCNGKSKIEAEMLLTLKLQMEFIEQDYLYTPIYIVDEGIIKDILFLVYNLGMKPKKASYFRYFISSTVERFNISSYVVLKDGKFYLYKSEQCFKLNTCYYSRAIYYYSYLRGIKLSEHRKLYINPPCYSDVESEMRVSKMELCIRDYERR